MVLTKDILTELLVFSQACWNYRLPVDCGIQRLLILCFLSCMLGSIVSSWREALSSCTSLRLLPGHLPCRCSSRVAVRLNLVVREISFNMQGGWRYWRGLRKCLDTRKRGLWKDLLGNGIRPPPPFHDPLLRTEFLDTSIPTLIGHQLCMPLITLPGVTLRCTSEGGRKRGWPKQTWRRTVDHEGQWIERWRAQLWYGIFITTNSWPKLLMIWQRPYVHLCTMRINKLSNSTSCH